MESVLDEEKMTNDKQEMTWRDIQGWFNYSELYDYIVSEINDDSTIVEIGCWKGKSTAYLCERIRASNKNIQLYCVDLWDDSLAAPMFHKNSKEYQEYISAAVTPVFDIFKQNMEKCGFIDMINIIREDSSKASNRFNDHAVDFCFVDGDHSYEATKKDIDSWYPKMKSGGFYCGHDYVNMPPRQVKPAVDEFASKNNFTVKSTSSCWFIKLP